MHTETKTKTQASTFTCPELCKAAFFGSTEELLARNVSDVVRMSWWTVEVVLAAVLLEVVTVVTVVVVSNVVTVVVTSLGTKGSGLIVTTGALRVPTTATMLPCSACVVLCTTSPRKEAVYSCSAMALVDDPSGTVTKQLNLVPVPPAVLEDSAVDEPPSPNKSFTAVESSPKTSATLSAKEERISDNCPSLSRENSRFNTSTVTRAEAPPRQNLLP